MLHVERADAFDDIVQNWVRWHRAHRKAGRCMSLEGGWRAKRYHEAPPIDIPLPVDKKAAERVEDAWKGLPSFQAKMILKWHYVFNRTPGAICRSLRQRGEALAPSAYPLALLGSRQLLRQALEKKTNDAHTARHAVAAYASPDGRATRQREKEGSPECGPFCMV